MYNTVISTAPQMYMICNCKAFQPTHNHHSRTYTTTLITQHKSQVFRRLWCSFITGHETQ